MVGAVFGTETELSGIDYGIDRSKVSERYGDDDVAVGGKTFEGLVDIFSKTYTFGKSGIHFPVACYNVLSHFFIFYFECYGIILSALAVAPRASSPHHPAQCRRQPVFPNAKLIVFFVF